MKLHLILYVLIAALTGWAAASKKAPRASPPRPVPYQVDTRGKYYVEAGPSVEEGHYDRRYFHGMLTDDAERQLALRLLIRAYLSQFHALGIETWLAHGTLLGWRWNGKVLPWDGDLDVQVSLGSLNYMAVHLNHSMHEFHYVNELTGRAESRSYLLDVNPYYTERTRGNRMNVIDARWIDTSTGMFVDITGLTELRPTEDPGLLTCKNNHRYHTKDLFPLWQSNFEGAVALVPRDFDHILAEEYGSNSLVATRFEGYTFDPTSKTWIKDKPSTAEDELLLKA